MKLREMFFVFGPPRLLHSDNDRKFVVNVTFELKKRKHFPIWFLLEAGHVIHKVRDVLNVVMEFYAMLSVDGYLQIILHTGQKSYYLLYMI